MSGVKWSRQAYGGLVKCLPGDPLTCSQVGRQSRADLLWLHANMEQRKTRGEPRWKGESAAGFPVWGCGTKGELGEDKQGNGANGDLSIHLGVGTQ